MNIARTDMRKKMENDQRFFNDHLDRLRAKIAELEKNLLAEMDSKNKWANRAQMFEEENKRLKAKEGA